MTPKEKAKYLKDKFQKQIFFHVTDERLDINEAKGLALIAVDEMYNIASENDNVQQMNYLVDVKQEIEKL
jgi:hypothetical protein